ncbi:MAG: hypothetical protein GY717_08790 [Rhodobacteraceae bacterium]|nr:hypothetical protein [Paracoccaceae bacterium]
MPDHITREELDLALPDVLAAPKDGSTVEMLCRRPDRNQRDFTDILHMSVADGIAGDYEMGAPWLKLPDGSPDPRIQVSIIPRRVLDLVWRDRENTNHPGDAIVTDLDMTLHNLPVGTRLQIGTAVVEVSDVWNDGCVKWKVRMGRPANDWISAPEHEALRLRGIYCKIVGDGEVRLGDTITKL